MSKTVILSCPTLRGELLAALSETSSEAAVYFLPRRLHNDPKELHVYLQGMIDRFHNADRIVICPSRCGGGTADLRATSAPLILPRTRDCLDILLSGDTLDTLHRDIRGVYFTANWMEFFKNSEFDLDKLTKRIGRENAEKCIRRLFKSFNDFYIIDTGCYDVQEVKDYIEPLVRILDGTVTTLSGGFKILHKIASEEFDEDFIMIPQGELVPADAFLPNQ